MLAPDNRYTYLNQLKPPAGYTLDRALATTFSLDLLTLLIAPLAMVFYECQDKDEAITSRVEVIEALRRVVDRLVIFCQKGRIDVPKTASLLYSYLEPVVVEVQPAGGSAVFHPKTWLLRFTGEDRPVFYRFLCLSRNLTFDHSWDTVLSLEGEVQERKRGFSTNRPLRDFVAALPGLAERGLPESHRAHIELVADEVGRVIFETPPGFDNELEFIPSGIEGYRYPRLFGGSCKKLAVISPFISGEWLSSMRPAAQENYLITRAESLDALPDGQYQEIAVKFSLYTMHETAQAPDLETDEEEPMFKDAADPSGLHAKIYVIEDGPSVSLATGSANATNSAFRGHNVEFMVKLHGRRNSCGLDQLFGKEPDHAFPGKMFRPYQRSGELSEAAAIKKELEEMLNEGRRVLITGGPALRAEAAEDGLYNLNLFCEEALKMNPDIKGLCYPITLKKERGLDTGELPGGTGLTFANMPLADLTGFMAFRLEAKYKGEAMALSFVLNLPVEGMPAERDREILHAVIADREQFMRYLLFLLAEEQDAYHLRAIFNTGAIGNNEGKPTALSLPLLEELVRTFSRHPAKIERIARLVAELEQSEKGLELLPADFRQVWSVIEAARGEAAPS